MAEFNLADMLRNVSAQDLGQQDREQIVYYDIDLIDADERNFYELSDVDSLAANIELMGLQQPVRVRPNPEDASRVILVSGHRRRAALQLLVDEGKEQFRQVACILEQPAASEALQELRLIYANSGTRKMTPAEISKQAERVEVLLYELKEQGMEFPGRMRDHVAEACKVSKSKLARLKVIREKLDATWQLAFERQEIAESTAYALAQQPDRVQEIIYGSKFNSDGHIQEWHVTSAVNRIKQIDAIQCEGHPCENRENMYSRSLSSRQYDWCSQCCKDCHNFMTCSKVCPKLKAKQKELKKNNSDQKQSWEAAERQRKKAETERISAAWKNLGAVVEMQGATVDKAVDVLASYDWEKKSLGEALRGEKCKESYVPFGTPGKKLAALADLLHCTTDYLLGRTDTPEPAATWHDPTAGDLPQEGETVIAAVQYSMPHGPWVTEDLRFSGGKFLGYGCDMPEDVRIFWQPRFRPPINVSESGTEETEEE